MKIIKAFELKSFVAKNSMVILHLKKQYFFGIKVHMIVDVNGIPIEFCFNPGSTSDIAGLKMLPCELPKRSFLFADRAYNSYSLYIREMAEFILVPRRKKNMTRQYSQSGIHFESYKKSH